jgi:hypothetical protein
MARVLADTNVPFPFSLMDLMLALSQDRIHTLLWSDRLLDEWERVIVREQHRSPTAASRASTLITWNLTDALERTVGAGGLRRLPQLSTVYSPARGCSA